MEAINFIHSSFDPASQLFQFRNSLFKFEKEIDIEGSTSISDESYENPAVLGEDKNFIYYEEPFIIRHLESGKIVSLLSNEIAEEIGILKVVLTTDESQSFIAKGIGKTKGKIIMFGDRITMTSKLHPDLSLHLQPPDEEKPEIELKVNGKEEATYFSFKQIQENLTEPKASLDQTEFPLKSHDYIRISCAENEGSTLSSANLKVRIERAENEETQTFKLLLKPRNKPEKTFIGIEKKNPEYNPWCTWQIIPLQKYDN